MLRSSAKYLKASNQGGRVEFLNFSCKSIIFLYGHILKHPIGEGVFLGQIYEPGTRSGTQILKVTMIGHSYRRKADIVIERSKMIGR